MLLVGLALLRNDGQKAQKELKTKYKTMVVDRFEKLDFSPNWTVSIRQGNTRKVELAIEDEVFKPMLENVNGTLYFKVKANNKNRQLRALVMVPSLREIKATGNTKIILVNFKSDSISIRLENGAGFTGKNNDFKHVSYKTSGVPGSDIQIVN